MIQLFETMKSALERRENVVLCSILASSGSAPRGAGAKMAVFQNGQALGTIGGGAVERIAAQQATELFQTGASYCQAFCLAPNQVNDIGMICGGNVTIYIQILKPENADIISFLEEVCELFGKNENSWLLYELCGGEVAQMDIYTFIHCYPPLS